MEQKSFGSGVKSFGNVSMSSRQSKYWVFTLNNYTDDELLDIHLLGETTDVTYLVYGKEVGESGTPHLQGYVELASRCRLSGIRKLLGSRGHYEPRKGTAAEASKYCKKDGVFMEYGTISTISLKPGRRTDLLAVKETLDNGGTIGDVAESHFGLYLQYRRGLESYIRLKHPPAIRPNLEVYVLWGATGVGKSRIAHHLFPDIGHVFDSTLKWFDGYGGEPTVLIDDFRSDGVRGDFLLRLLDIYPLKVPVKGGFVTWSPERIIITSNEEPPWGLERERAPLLRRLCGVFNLERPIDFDDTEELTSWRRKLGLSV